MTSPYYLPPPSDPRERGFWERPGFLLALVLLSAVPLLWPTVPPLVDLPGHMGRYRVQLDIDSYPPLADWYDFEWQLIANLGIDLLVIPLAPLFGLQLAVKLIVVTIPAMTAAGFLWVAREIHGRIPPTAAFALPFAYSYPFLFGFANFALSMALAFLAFGLWLHLGRKERVKLRAALFVPISTLIWVTHAFGWGTLGVLAFSAELVRQHDRGHRFVEAGFRAALHCLALTPPIALMLMWRSGQAAGQTADMFNYMAKLYSMLIVLRDRWLVLDFASLGVILLLILRAVRSQRIAFSRNLAASALFLLAVFILLPRIIFGSAYADMRLAPFIFAVAVLAIRWKRWEDVKFARTAALAALAFFLIRTGATTASSFLYHQEWERELAALDHVPQGARLVSFVGRSCRHGWYTPRMEHLPGLALVRNHAFSNDQWTMAGAQLLTVTYPKGGEFVRDPSQIVTPAKCPREQWLSIDQALKRFPRDAFDYVWLVDPPRYDPALTQGLRPIWRHGSSVLFQVE